MKKRTQNYYLYMYMSMCRCDARLQAMPNSYYWKQFRSRDLSFNLFPVGSHSLGHVICLLIYFRLAAMLLNILKSISMFILLPLTLSSGAYYFSLFFNSTYPVNYIAKEIFWAEIYRGRLLFRAETYRGRSFFRGETRRFNDCPFFK